MTDDPKDQPEPAGDAAQGAADAAQGTADAAKSAENPDAARQAEDAIGTTPEPPAEDDDGEADPE